jgi:dTDP-glucose 4,6-dehydratase
MSALENGRPGGTYLFGGRCERNNLWLARKLCALLDDIRPRPDAGRHADRISLVADRPGHDHRYAIDPRTAEGELGWRAETGIDAGLAATVTWYLDNPGWLAPPSALGRLGALEVAR